MSQKLRTFLSLILALSLLCSAALAHPGRTDSKGGHKDNKNKSGLGSYHYHCDGNPEHLHLNGVCPYAASAEDAQNDSVGARIALEIPEGAAVEWVSSDENVAIVISEDLALAVGAGECMLEARNGERLVASLALNIAEAEEIDVEALQAELPEGFVFRGAPESAAIAFAQRCGLAHEEVLP